MTQYRWRQHVGVGTILSRATGTTRAARFAALGDPVRLAVVDHLTLGDAAPSELGAAVGLPSNLLAHHLRVLEAAGLVRRVRSEGDRRRTYVQLRLDGPAVAAVVAPPLGDPARPAAGDADRVVFVCTRNSARSQLAAALWRRSSELPVAYEDLGPATADRTPAATTTHGVRLHWSVPDPVRVDTDPAFDAALDDLSRRVRHLAAALAPQSSPDAG